MNNRQQKVARQIQKDLGVIFQQRGMATYNGALITVSEVRMSPDLAVAKVYISVFPFDKTAAVMKQIQEEVKLLRGELGKQVRHQLRIVPELQFWPDETMERLSNIDDLLK